MTGHEHKVQQFYDTALHCYQHIMGDRWHHGDPEASACGLPRSRCCEILEERVVALTGLPLGGKALDFGSGIGGPTLHMAKVTGASFIGVTNNDRLNNLSRKKAADLRLSESVDFLTIEDTGYQRLPFADSSFDAVTFFESVCHLPDKAAFFREVTRVLKPGGRVGGSDWIQRPFGEHRDEAEIMKYMEPINQLIRIPWHGTVEGYRDMMAAAGLQVFVARDLFAGTRCWNSVQDAEQSEWLGYDGPDAAMFRDGEKALAAAREAGVFSVGMWIAGKPV